MKIKKEPEFSLVLIPAPDEALQSAEYQSGLQEFAKSLTAHDVEFNSNRFMRESAYGVGFRLGEFGLIVKTIGPFLTGLIIAWLHARRGRKVRLKFGDVEVEATTVEDVEKLIKLTEKDRKKPRRKKRS